jgi:hypothetical protein
MLMPLNVNTAPPLFTCQSLTHLLSQVCSKSSPSPCFFPITPQFYSLLERTFTLIEEFLVPALRALT